MARFLFFVAIIGGVIFSPFYTEAAFSENYKINADVIGVGGEAGDSESYMLKDTLGEPIIGPGTSETYKTKAGFWYMVTTAISLIVDSNTVNLGTLTPGTPVTGQTIISVATDAWDGYDLYTSQNHQMLHMDTVTTIPNYSCDIGTPCLWSGVGLGFSVTAGTSVEAKWGTSPNFKYAYFPLSPTVFHQKSGYLSGVDQTTVGYKLDAPSTQKSGTYSNIITYTAMERL